MSLLRGGALWGASLVLSGPQRAFDIAREGNPFAWIFFVQITTLSFTLKAVQVAASPSEFPRSMRNDRLLGTCIALIYVVQAMVDALDAKDAADDWRESVLDTSQDLLESSEFSGLSAAEEAQLREVARKVIAHAVSQLPIEDLMSDALAH